MKPFLRIKSHPNLKSLGTDADDKPGYQETLVKLIPAEVVGLYLGGKNAIEAYFQGPARPDSGDEPNFWLWWTIICLVGLILYRRWATSEKDAGVPPEWWAVGLSAASFLVWVYSFGDVFREKFHIWHALIATLLVLGWTFFVPFVYKKYAARL
jgi:hypothetical protein